MTVLRLAPLSTVVMLCASSIVSQVQAQAVRTQIPTVTRLVQIYSEYEQRLVDAINRRDTAEIDRLVANDFELRSANNIGDPTPRADWIAQSLKEPSASMSIEQMAVHDYSNIRIVSFVMKRADSARRERAIAVIDVWMQLGESSVLKVRYAAFQDTRSVRIPGETRQRQIDKRY
jgi:uncharacterized protein DUF4440